MKIDPRSERIALYYEGPSLLNVPARDLTENDLARLVSIEHGDISGAAFQGALDKLVERLLAGPYRKTPPAKEAMSDE